jgi:hypothetical protein
MTVNWTDTTTHDTGNGALVHVSTTTSWPGVKQYEFVSYCGRESDKTWYEAEGDSERLEFSTPAKAADRYRECVKLRDQSDEIEQLKKQLANH